MPGEEVGTNNRVGTRFRFHLFRFKFNFVIWGDQSKMAAKFFYSIVNEQGSKGAQPVKNTGRYSPPDVTFKRGGANNHSRCGLLFIAQLFH
jgi:hypothetical protein